jgi:hypothetical protein
MPISYILASRVSCHPAFGCRRATDRRQRTLLPSNEVGEYNLGGT